MAPVSEGPMKNAAKPTRPGRGRFAGRDRQVGELHEYFRRASTGQRQIVFVTGEPGIGKAALVVEFEHQASMVRLFNTCLPPRKRWPTIW